MCLSSVSVAESLPSKSSPAINSTVCCFRVGERNSRPLSSLRRQPECVKGLGILLFGCIAGLVLGVSAKKMGLLLRSPKPPQPKVTNKTSSARVSSLRQLDNGDVDITFVNQSDKAIYAYTLITSENSIRKGMTVFETVAPIESGKSKTERIPGPNLAPGSIAGPDVAREVVFSALYLEGGAIEGDEKDAGRLQRTMIGMKEQAIFALQMLHAAASANVKDSGKFLETMESQVASMSVENNSTQTSREREKGRSMVKEGLLAEIKKLRMRMATSGFDVKSEIARMTPYYERLAAKL